MESTTPNANFQPQIVQYTPAESSMLSSVPALVSPKRSSLAFVRTNTSANLNLRSRAPSAPTPAAPLPHGDPCFTVAGPPSSDRLKAAIRTATTLCWVAPVGNRSSAWPQALNAPLGSPTRSARCAGAARRRVRERYDECEAEDHGERRRPMRRARRRVGGGADPVGHCGGRGCLCAQLLLQLAGDQ